MRNTAKFLLIAALLASVPASATCPNLPAIPKIDSALQDYAWAFQDQNREVGLASRFPSYGWRDGRDVLFYAYRTCTPQLGKPYINYPDKLERLPDALFAKVLGGEDGFTYFESTEFLGHAEAGKAKLKTTTGLGDVPAKFDEEYVELQFRDSVELSLLGTTGGDEKIPVTIAIVASAHALSLAPLTEWNQSWEKEPIDSHIQLRVEWLKITRNTGSVTRGREASDFAVLEKYGVADPEMIAKLDGEPVLQSLAEFLKGYPVEETNHIILLKDGWEISLDGLEALNEQLGRLPSGAIFDVYSIHSPTASVGFLEGLTAKHGGRYLESNRKDVLDIPRQNVGGRIFGKIRKWARDEADRRGIAIDKSPSVVNRLTVLADDPYFEVGNLITPDHLAQMRYLFRLALCLAEQPSIGTFEIEARLGRAGLHYQPDDQMRPLFRKWFRGFELLPASPIARKTPEEMVRDAKDDPTSTRRYLEDVAGELDALAAASGDTCAIFVPSRIFMPATE